MWTAPIFAVALAASTAQVRSVEDIVRRHVPYGTLGLDPKEADADLRTCHAVLETDEEGRPAVIAAGYVAYDDLRLRIIEVQDDASRVVAGDAVGAGWLGCALTAVDFDGDARPEVFLTVVLGMKGEHVRGWVFRWLGTAASPEPDARLTRVAGELSNPEVIDVLHDGTMQIHEYEVHQEGDDVWQTFWVSSAVPRSPNPLARFAAAWTICFDALCIDDPTELRNVNSSTRYTLRLVNGDRAGAHRVGVTSVEVNDRELLPRAWRGRADEFIDVPIGRLKPGVEVAVSVAPQAGERRLVAVLVGQP